MRVTFRKKVDDKSMTPDEQYKEYLYKHINGVRNVYHDILRPILINEGVSNLTLKSIDMHIDVHDKSKYDQEEWSAYRNHFYDPKGHPRSHSDEFNQAWNHHQKHNPHHWQYWCLINDCDEPQVEPLEIPFEYVIEMLCDWHSAGKFYGNTAYEWYQKQKDKMILHPNTKVLIEKYLPLFDTYNKLDERTYNIGDTQYWKRGDKYYKWTSSSGRSEINKDS